MIDTVDKASAELIAGARGMSGKRYSHANTDEEMP